MCVCACFPSLLNASPHGGQNGCSDGAAEGHLGGWGAAERDGVALVCTAALDCGHIVDSQQQGVGGVGVAEGVVSPAALRTEASEG